jgi:hypothetical protein
MCMDIIFFHISTIRKPTFLIIFVAHTTISYHVLLHFVTYLAPASDIHLEPHDLIPLLISNKRPATIGIAIAPPHPTPPLPYDCIAIDTTTVPANNATIPHVPDNSDQATNHIYKVHHVGIHHKLCNEAVVSQLNSSRILLLPFPFDLFTAHGYFACQFFFLPT